MNARLAIMALAGAAAMTVAGTAWAQRGPGGGAGPNVDTTTTVVITGEVVRFTAGPGEGTPELVVRQANGTETAFTLGPYRYLEAQSFVAQAGDGVEVTAFPCAGCSSGYAVVEVKNSTRGVTFVLRDTDGTPLWIGPQGQMARRHLAGGAPMQGRGTGMAAMGRRGPGGCAGMGPDMSRATVFSGPVKAFTGAPGQRFPTLVIGTTGGDASVLLSPYRALIQAGYTPSVGAQVEVKAAPVVVDGQEHWVAITVKDVASGLEVVLRNGQTGLPLVGGRGWAY